MEELTLYHICLSTGKLPFIMYVNFYTNRNKRKINLKSGVIGQWSSNFNEELNKCYKLM